LADRPLFFGIDTIVQMFAFVFDCQNPIVDQLAKEVRIKPVLRRLKPK
jgi:hypothetical protein